ncbi:MAG: EAL domain-containing protein [Treponema sp.]|nr:EAL domain-containing protein [Treponema sp.]
MWDYSFAIPSLLFITLILIFYFSMPTLPLRKNQIFLFLLIVESIEVFVNVASSWVDTEYHLFPMALVHFFNVVYFSCFYLRIITFFLFLACVLQLFPFKSRLAMAFLLGPYLICTVLAVLSPWTGWIYTFGVDGYEQGPLYTTLYNMAIFYIFISFFCLFEFRKNIKRRRNWFFMLLYELILTCGIILRKLYPDLLLFDTFCVMAVVIVYLAFQNPEFYLEHRSSIFNVAAFQNYIDEKNGNLSHRVLGVTIHNYPTIRDIYGSEQMDAALSLINDYLSRTFKDCIIFYLRRGRFLIMGPWDMQIDKVLQLIKDRFAGPWFNLDVNLYLTATYICIDLAGSVASSDILLSALTTSMDRADHLANTDAMVITEKVLTEQLKESTMKRYLEDAITNNSVEVFLQPLVDATSGKIVGAEALARIRDTDGNLLSPTAFIPIAEENGKINELGEQVFEKICHFIKDNALSERGVSWINVNLSPVQFMRSDLAQRYAAIIEKYGIDFNMIHLEITEANIEDDNFMRNQIYAMREKGFNFVLDDYGTGYSNISRLKKCPFINVKLDMSVVRDYYNEPDEILPNMILAFKNMHFSVTAEGIEEERMAEIMKNIGCDYFQGFYYSQPIPMNEFKDLLDKLGA